MALSQDNEKAVSKGTKPVSGIFSAVLKTNTWDAFVWNVFLRSAAYSVTQLHVEYVIKNSSKSRAGANQLLFDYRHILIVVSLVKFP